MMGIAVPGGTVEVLDLPASRRGRPAHLLLHEGLGSVSMWRDFPQALAQATGARVVAYSRLGFGRSTARPDPYTPRFMHEEAERIVPALREVLALERPVLVGHSTGASMALLHAAHTTGTVAGVVAMAPLIDVEDGNVESIREARRTFETTGWRDKLARHHAHPIDQVFSNWNDTWLDPGFRRWAITRDLEAIRCPVLGIVGVDDPYSSPRQLELLAAGACNAATLELIQIAACGHVPHREQPARVLQAIADFSAG